MNLYRGIAAAYSFALTPNVKPVSPPCTYKAAAAATLEAAVASSKDRLTGDGGAFSFDVYPDSAERVSVRVRTHFLRPTVLAHRMGGILLLTNRRRCFADRS